MRMRTVEVEWRLRQVMAERGMFATTDLMPLLAERGVNLSATQVYRLVTQTPERLNMRVLAAACDALECTPDELMRVRAVQAAAPRAVAGARRPREGASGATPGRTPTRVKLTPES